MIDLPKPRFLNIEIKLVIIRLAVEIEIGNLSLKRLGGRFLNGCKKLLINLKNWYDIVFLLDLSGFSGSSKVLLPWLKNKIWISFLISM